MIKVTQSKRKSISILRVLKLIRRIISIAYKVHHQRSHSRKQYYNWCLVIMATMLVGFSSCDEYEPKDNTIHVGYVLCEDHSCMRPEDYFRQSKQKGIGVVFAEQTKDHPLMAVMLEEINNAFCDSLGLSNAQVEALRLLMVLPIHELCKIATSQKLRKVVPLLCNSFIFMEEGRVITYLALQSSVYSSLQQKY